MQSTVYGTAVRPEQAAANIRRIRAEQRQCGRAQCFATEVRFRCEARDCPWRAECLRPIAAWLR